MPAAKLQWHYTAYEDLGVLAVSGSLTAATAGRFGGAVNWTLAHGRGPLILDVAAVRGWSLQGQDALAHAARRLAARGRALELAGHPACGLPAVRGAGGAPLRVHANLRAAVAAHGGAPGAVAGRRQWYSHGWGTTG